MTNKTIDIYSASAGSGKTYTIAMRYIDMLIDAPHNYQHILAVTFTNKATSEMMERIVRDLYIITYEGDNEKLLKDKADCVERQRKYREKEGKAKVDDEEIVKRCKMALSLVLNDYGRFSVSTIDSFVQRVIRAFAFEAGLTSDYGVELDSDMVLGESIDLMMKEMKDDKELREWMLEYVRMKMEEDGRWNVEGGIRSMARTILTDDGRAFVKQTSSKGREVIKRLKDAAKKEYTDVKAELIRIIGNLSAGLNEGALAAMNSKRPLYNCISRFDANDKYGKVLVTYVLDDADSKTRIGNFVEDYEKDELVKKDKKLDLYRPVVKSAAKEFYDFIKGGMFERYHTSKMIYGQIYSIGILADIAAKIDEWSKEHNSMPMANSNDLLKVLIGQTDVPFIYEKIGTRYHHIMIDEFQDTSVTQWDNFHPLVDNSASSNYKSMLVGDTKQAIYRWRNTDWHILANMDDAEKESLAEYVRQMPLDTNWRSFNNVIRFNNAIFCGMKAKVSEQLGSLYGQPNDKDVEAVYRNFYQKVSPKNADKGGLVRVKIYRDIEMPKEGSKGMGHGNANVRKAILTDMIGEIRELCKKGYNQGDICVLVRTNKEGGEVMEALEQNGIASVSTDSLKLISSPVINGVMSALKYVSDPSDRASLISFMGVAKRNGMSVSEFWHANVGDDANDDSLGNRLKRLSGTGLMELVGVILSDFVEKALVDADFVYVESFLDLIRNYMAKRHVNLSDFIEYMDNYGSGISVAAPENDGAVNVMSIHKSKGLEFKVVLIPYLDWSIVDSKKPPMIWASTENIPNADLRELEKLPVLGTSKLKNTYFNGDFNNERRLQNIDSLNLQYVAQTRAKCVLMMWGKMSNEKSTKKKESADDKDIINTPIDYVATLFNTGAKSEMEGEGQIDMEVKWSEEEVEKSETVTVSEEWNRMILVNDDTEMMTLSEYEKCAQVSEEERKTKVVDQYVYTLGEMPDNSAYVIEKSNINTEESESYKIHRWEGIEINKSDDETSSTARGTMWHDLMSRIMTKADIDMEFAHAVSEGEVDMADAEQMKNYIKAEIEKSKAKEWFDVDASEVYNEMSIVSAKKVRRPDRVVISEATGKVVIVDYKFGAEHELYKQQVSDYISLFKNAGYDDVEGYLWYIDENGEDASKIVDVK